MLTTKNRDASLTLTVLAVVLLVGCAPPGPRAIRDGERLIRQGRFEQAIVRLEKGVRLLPKNAQAWNYLGLAYHTAGRADEATRAYQQALVLDRDLAAARYNLGCLHLERSNPASAIVELTTYTALQPKAGDGWMKLGTAQLRARQLDAAERSFQQAKKLTARAPEALNGLGLIQVQRRRYTEASQQFSAALSQQSDYAPALLNVAVVSHQYLNNRAFALQKYREYLALKPSPVNAANVQETVNRLEMELRPPPRPATTEPVTQLVAASKPPESAATNKPPATFLPGSTSSPGSTGLPASPPQTPPRTLAATSTLSAHVAPSNPVVSNRAELVSSSPPQPPVELVRLEQEEPIKPVRDVASNDSRRAAKAEAEDAKTFSLRQETAVPSGPPSSTGSTGSQPANEKSGPITRLNPKNKFGSNERDSPGAAAGAKEGQATLATASKGRTEQAQVSTSPAGGPRSPSGIPRYRYRSPVPLQPGNRGEAERLVSDGVRAQERNRLNEAIDSYRKATQADPSFFEAHYNLGVAAFEAGDLAQALTAYEQALVVNLVSVKARFNFAIVLQKAGFWRDAAIELEKTLAASPTEARAHFTLANLYAQQLGESQRARLHYARVLELEPQHPQATAIRFWLEANP